MVTITKNHHQSKYRVVEPNSKGHIYKTIPVPKAWRILQKREWKIISHRIREFAL